MPSQGKTMAILVPRLCHDLGGKKMLMEFLSLAKGKRVNEIKPRVASQFPTFSGLWSNG